MIMANEKPEKVPEAPKVLEKPSAIELSKVFRIMLEMLMCSRRRGKKEDTAGLIIPKQILQEFPKDVELCADWDPEAKAWIFYVLDSPKRDRQIITRSRKLLLPN